MPSLSRKERKAKFNTNDLIFRKKFNLPSGAPLSAECNSIECSSTEYKSPESLESLINKNKHFGTKLNKQLIFQIYQKNLFFNTLKEIYDDRRI